MQESFTQSGKTFSYEELSSTYLHPLTEESFLMVAEGLASMGDTEGEIGKWSGSVCTEEGSSVRTMSERYNSKEQAAQALIAFHSAH